MSCEDDVREGALALGVAIGAEHAATLCAFADLLVRWNARSNLISRGDEKRLVPRHLLDSLSLAPLLRMRRVLDVGTGAGLPGVPLAIACPDAEFVLMDRSERRLRFVRHAVAELGLGNVSVCEADLATYRARPLFDTVVSRAVAAPAALWPMVRGLLTDSGVALFQCGDPSTLEQPAMARAESKQMRIPGLDVPHWVLCVSKVAA